MYYIQIIPKIGLPYYLSEGMDVKIYEEHPEEERGRFETWEIEQELSGIRQREGVDSQINLIPA